MEHCSNHTCEKQFDVSTDEHIQCPLCLNAAYCSEACRVSDFQMHACEQIRHVADPQIQQFVPYAFEDTLTAEELSAVPVTDPIYRSTLLVNYGEDMRVSQVLQPAFIIGDDLVAYTEGTNEAARGQAPGPKLLSARTFEIVIEELGEPNHESRNKLTVAGDIPKHMIFSTNTVNATAKKLAGSLRKGASASYLFWLSGEKKLGGADFGLAGVFKIHLKVAGMKPVHTRGGYDITEAAHMQFWKNLSSTLKNRLDLRIKTKFPNLSARDRDALRVVHAWRGGIQVALTFQVVPKTNVARLLDVEFVVPDYLLKPEGKYEEDRALPPLPTEEAIKFGCDVTDINQVIGLVMAIEHRNAVDGDVPEKLQNSAGIVRQYARTLESEGEAPKRIPPEVHAAVRQLVEAQHELIGLTISSKSQSYYRKKLGRGRGANVGTVARNIANELVAEMQKLRADKQKATNKAKKAYYRAQQNRLQKSMDNFEIVAQETLATLTPSNAQYPIVKEALDPVNEARSSILISQ